MSKTINPSSELIQWLDQSKPAWWQNLVNDKELYIDIRSGDYINVYYQGGSFMRLGWDYTAQKPTATIHMEFVPLDRSTNYLNYRLDHDRIEFEEARPIALENFTQTATKAVKAQIAKHYPSDSEKGIQARFVVESRRETSSTREKGVFLDSECTGHDRSRIDMVWMDYPTMRFVLVELKTIGDTRLYGTDSEDATSGQDNIQEQLRRYASLAREQKSELEDYFRSNFEAKRKLGLLPEHTRQQAIQQYALEEKPILIVGDCTRTWISNNAEDLDTRVRDWCLGTVYRGRATNIFDGLNAPNSSYYHWY